MDKIRKYIKELSSGTKIMFKEFFNKETNKKQRANMWTFSRLIISPIILILMIIGMPISAAIAAIFGALTDFFDGRSARKHDSTSEFGKLLDPVVDKVFALFSGISLTISNPLFLINLIGEGLITATNMTYKIKYNNIDIKSNLIGKIKQWPLFATFALGFLSANVSNISNITNSAIIITSLFQVATLKSYIIKNKLNSKNCLNDVIISNDINEEEKEKTKIIEKTNIDFNKSETRSQIQEYTNLRNVLNNIIYLQEENSTTVPEENIKIEKGVQKSKK